MRRAPSARRGRHRAGAHARGRRGRAPRRARIRRRAARRRRSRRSSSEALDANSSRFLELAETHLTGHVRRSRTRWSAWTGNSRRSSESARRRTAPSRRRSPPLASGRAGLANALADPARAGAGGEAQLRNVVELAGMVEHCDYVSQATTATTSARYARTWSCGSRGEARRDRREGTARRIPRRLRDVRRCRAPRHFADHARQVRDHVGKLSAKQYWRQFEPSPDFVVMFLPDESYLRARTRARPRSGRTPGLERDPRVAEHAHGDPSDRRDATWQQETDRRERARGVRSRTRALRAHREVGDHFSKLGRSPRRSGRCLQRDRRLARDTSCWSRRASSRSTASSRPRRHSGSRAAARPLPSSAPMSEQPARRGDADAA